MEMIRALWAYRGFILGSVQREFQSKYSNSLLGAAWNIINPLSMIVVYTIIFSRVMKSRLPELEGDYAFSIYLCAGLLTWGLFAEIANGATNMFVGNANLLKKLSFPRLCLPLIVIANAVVNFCVVFGLFVIFLLISGNFPGIVFFAIIPLLTLQILFAIGVGISLGIVNVFFRDVGQFFGIFLTFWFWLTPVVYPSTILPQEVHEYMRLNPMYRLIVAYQDTLVYARWPNWYSLWPVLALSVLLCAYGLYLFRRRSGEMVDEL
jgi:lipopolysaccharide transport system permease protein